MRVVQVTDYGSPHAGAFVPMLRAAMDAVRKRGWAAAATVPARAPSRSREWLPALQADYGDSLLVAPDVSRREFGRWLTEIVDAAPGPTILHSHMTAYDLAAADVARRRDDVRAIWHFHTVLGTGLRVRIRNRLRFALAGRYVERMLCVGPGLAEAILARGAPPAKVLDFPNGLDADAFPARIDPSERSAARVALDIPPDATVLLHVGREWQLKGGDLFLDAFQQLQAQRGDLLALMVRGGEEARAEVSRRGLGDRVRVLGGTAQVRRLHAASDLMLATSRGEGTLPFTVLEALASGLGVVATAIPGHAIDGVGPASLRFAPVDAEAIAEAAASLLAREPATAREEGDASHAWVASRRGLQAWSERLVAVYEEAAHGWGATIR